MALPPDPDAPDLLAKISSWGWLVGLAIWGGTASYLTRIRRMRLPFSLVELIGEWTVSGFVGVVTALGCYKLEFDFMATAFVTGIAGHMGARAIGMFENYLIERAKKLRP